MRAFVNFLLFLAVCASLCFLYEQSRQPAQDFFSESSITIRVPERVLADIASRKNESRLQDQIDDGDCLVWGPFDAKGIVAVQKAVRKAGLIERMEVADRFLPDRWIVYLGPYERDIAALAFVKQFRAQGYRNVRPILSGDLSYGVQIEAFDNRESAEIWLHGGGAPDVEGMKVTNRLGEPSDQLDLVFRDLTSEQRDKLRVLSRQWKATELRGCEMPPS